MHKSKTDTYRIALWVLRRSSLFRSKQIESELIMTPKTEIKLMQYFFARVTRGTMNHTPLLGNCYASRRKSVDGFRAGI